MKYISEIKNDDGSIKGYLVRIGYIDGEPIFQKSFGAKKLEKAKTYARKTEEFALQEGLLCPKFAIEAQRNSTTQRRGVTVTKYVSRRKGRKRRFVFEARASLQVNGKKYWFCRSCLARPVEEAVQECVEWRQEKIKELCLI